MGYQPLENYGIIGDMHTCALVGLDGSIDWLCLPHFDSPSVFCKILDDKKGGQFQITATCETKQRQMYLFETNVLVTRFMSEAGVTEVIDFMPIKTRDPGTHVSRVVRIVKCTRGTMPMRMTCQPAIDYARRGHRLEVKGSQAFFNTVNGERALGLSASIDLRGDGDRISLDFRLQASDTGHPAFSRLRTMGTPMIPAPTQPIRGLFIPNSACRSR